MDHVAGNMFGLIVEGQTRDETYAEILGLFNYARQEREKVRANPHASHGAKARADMQFKGASQCYVFVSAPLS